MSAGRPDDRAPDLGLRPATAADAPVLCALATQVFLDTYATEGIRPAMAREVEQHFSTSAWLAELARPEVRIEVVERAGHLVAFSQLLLGERHPLVGNAPAAELSRLYVQAPFQRRGVGRLLLDRAEAVARSEGFATLWLTAWVGNARALAFYRRQRYRELGSTDYEFENERFENRLFARSLSEPRPLHNSPRAG
ncbi:MAG: GNAT family N-acetyltransferase [Burkholderiales bacterium]|nr:GNAT family N-acetyltransferase [Burkholderiales bacterium]